ncbi:MAG: type II secretion system protein, partial [Gemmataceae bacterium]
MARLRTTTRPSKARAGFTLIELLIAVLIISILATLVTLGVSKAMSYAKQVATKTEMGQIEQALGVAAIEMGRVPFIPSFLVLLPTPSAYDSYAGPDKAFADMSRRILT